MNITTYIPNELAERAQDLKLIGPDATQRGLVARIVREGLELEIEKAEATQHQQALAQHAV